MPSKLKIQKGDKFGTLTVIEELPPYINTDGSRKRLFKCKCICGKEYTRSIHSLKYTKHKCVCSYNAYGLSHNRIYRIWAGMNRRCNLDTCNTYKNYGNSMGESSETTENIYVIFCSIK